MEHLNVYIVAILKAFSHAGTNDPPPVEKNAFVAGFVRHSLLFFDSTYLYNLSFVVVCGNLRDGTHVAGGVHVCSFANRAELRVQ
jgi:hypothetical protein